MALALLLSSCAFTTGPLALRTLLRPDAVLMDEGNAPQDPLGLGDQPNKSPDDSLDVAVAAAGLVGALTLGADIALIDLAQHAEIALGLAGATAVAAGADDGIVGEGARLAGNFTRAGLALGGEIDKEFEIGWKLRAAVTLAAEQAIGALVGPKSEAVKQAEAEAREARRAAAAEAAAEADRLAAAQLAAAAAWEAAKAAEAAEEEARKKARMEAEAEAKKEAEAEAKKEAEEAEAEAKMKAEAEAKMEAEAEAKLQVEAQAKLQVEAQATAESELAATEEKDAAEAAAKLLALREAEFKEATASIAATEVATKEPTAAEASEMSERAQAYRDLCNTSSSPTEGPAGIETREGPTGTWVSDLRSGEALRLVRAGELRKRDFVRSRLARWNPISRLRKGGKA